jgi:hypothetical protein
VEEERKGTLLEERFGSRFWDIDPRIRSVSQAFSRAFENYGLRKRSSRLDYVSAAIVATNPR